MRNRMIDLIQTWAKTDERVVFLTGDLGFSVVEPLAEQLGSRFINVGVAEANMVGMALGLAKSGLRPVVYTIAPFLYARALEQVRNDLSQPNADVMMVGIGAGAMYGLAGSSHLALDDAHIISALPNVRVYTPAGAGELDWCFQDARAHEGPSYFRLGVAGHDDPPLKSGAQVTWQPGQALNLVTAGAMMAECQQAVAASGVDANLISLPLTSPVDIPALAARLVNAPTLTVFEGFAGNPLEFAVLSALAQRGDGQSVEHMNMGQAWPQTPGDRLALRAAQGLDVDTLTARVRAMARQTVSV